MRLLIDANISFKVATKIRKHFETVIHVSDIGLAVPAKDNEIWKFAKENNFGDWAPSDDVQNSIKLIDRYLLKSKQASSCKSSCILVIPRLKYPFGKLYCSSALL